MRSTLRSTAAVLGAALALAACSSGAPSADSSGDSGGSDNKTIAFVQGVAGDEFYITMQCGIEEKAKELGYTVTTQGPQKFDPTLQKPIVDSVTASKPAALLVAPTDVQAMQAPLEQAAAAGIKVVLVDTTVNDPSFAVSQISSDNIGGGKAAFEAIQEAKPDGGKVLVISTDPGISTVDARVDGFEEATKGDSSFTYLGVQYSHNDPATAANLVSAALQKDPDIVGIFATNLFAAEGSATGVRQAGAKDVTIVGFDAGPNQIKALQDGTVQALVAQQPSTIGMDGVEQADAALTGGSVEKEIQTGFTIITKDNLSGEGGDAAYKSTC
ncbi:substrate-binding domain-containing protein [Phycicoccus endophyticus]|uniref:Substrate-binding domain-containing protein n=1 Tax=Phycicoccus endophyticus TaxID=1690220 RepID=A0A7G9R2Y2_9MICO|nr:ABC transporter substrate-binding protein [Phycicoccus endophyticus]NHI20248.1 ABC transporter substrate-binding protein [Phycicoccus endophyticus]QNN49957.1 substrate-binding domain-containing protein [Phycicoccus endophyticus]GGL29294.1 ribose ABC transporter substrate-binding protein [Phycicoccus endophyticus]